jgi:glyoxylase-like metal-dependent hydrolase (beta-lactamase superfamily II)
MVAVGPRVSRLRAPNPSPMTLDGTNGYVVDGGDGAWIAIDPGPDDPAHIAAFVSAAHDAGAHYEAILVTHGHPDHYPGAAPLAAATGAPVYAHAAAAFPHDRTLADGERISAGAASLIALDTPGHARDHLIYVLEHERALFSGDVIIGVGTVVIAPPNGDMRAYQRTLHRLRDEYGDAAVIYGGHGPEMHDARAKIDEYIAHRERRETEILAVLGRGAATIPALVETIYRDIDRRLWPAAARQILAYLIALEREGRVTATPRNDALTPEQRALLDPDLSAIVNERHLDVVRAELGYGAEPPRLVDYALRGNGVPVRPAQ